MNVLKLHISTVIIIIIIIIIWHCFIIGTCAVKSAS